MGKWSVFSVIEKIDLTGFPQQSRLPLCEFFLTGIAVVVPGS